MAGEPFVFLDGKNAFDVESLLRCMSEISYDEFFSYVNGKNDFANWIEHSMQDKELAERIRPLSERDVILAVISDFLEKERAKMIIATPSSLNEDLLIKEVLEKNEEFLGTKNISEPEKTEKKDETKLSVGADKEENSKKEKGSTITIMDLPKRKHSLDKEFFIGVTFGVIIGILLTLIISKMIILG